MKKTHCLMPNAYCLFLIALCPFFISGCQEQGSRISASKTGTNGRIVVPVGEKFPKLLVGTWKADDYIWQLEFGGNGRILSVVYVMWSEKIDLKQGYIYNEGKDDKDSYAYFILGPCDGTYNPATRELKVKLSLSEYELRMPAGVLRGHGEDYLEGIISEDGKKWDVNWRGYSYLDGAQLPDINDINANPQKLVFRKIDGK